MTLGLYCTDWQPFVCHQLGGRAFQISFQEKCGLDFFFFPLQELERLEVERVEMIRQHLCQYTQLRHETDMFNQSVSLLFV